MTRQENLQHLLHSNKCGTHGVSVKLRQRWQGGGRNLKILPALCVYEDGLAHLEFEEYVLAQISTDTNLFFKAKSVT